MGANLNHTFIVDVEATCFAEDDQKHPTESRLKEVIEIGIVKMDLRSFDIVQSKSYVVQPKFTKISEFCTQLTGWKQSDVDKGRDLVQTFADIKRDFGMTKNHTWWSYGEFDKYILSIGCGKISPDALYHLESSPFSDMRAHFNAKTLLAMRFNFKRELGMAKALEHFNLSLDGNHHNGLDDATNTAKLVKLILGPRD